MIFFRNVFKNKFEEDPLCENSTCHKNKAVSNFYRKILACKPHKCNFEDLHAGI